jgi:hypothetical protein
MMTKDQDGEGSFREVRRRHLPLFDPKVHRHDRGWLHSTPEPDADRSGKQKWKRAGIFHYPHHEEDESDAEARNAGSCRTV